MNANTGRKPNVVLPSDVAGNGAVSLVGYQQAVRVTDKLPPGDLSTPILGLFGEVGSLLAVVKKKRREAAAYAAYSAAIVEECGDVLWYLTCIACHAGLDISTLCRRAVGDVGDSDALQTNELMTWADVQTMRQSGVHEELSTCMSHVAELTGELVGGLRADKQQGSRDKLSGQLVAILRALFSTAAAADVDLDRAARANLEKIFSRYPLDHTYPPLTDADVPPSERLPRRFEMFVEEHDVNGRTYVLLTCNGVIVGDRLTDNKAEEDDYRFHDVFHIAYAVHLGWSPTLRALFRVKRKSVAKLDENEDGARAGLIEEGISTFIFGRALERNLFEGLDRLDFDLLKLVQEFARGFEVERCALWQWERAILDGFRIFRELKRHRKGYVSADLENHTVTFAAVASQPDGTTSSLAAQRSE
jgi:NTP pyrophosphatase (non-canonical NTP hydrolase)